MPSSDPEILPPAPDAPPPSSKLAAFGKDYVSDPAIAFTAVSDPLIFMTPEYLGSEAMEHADVMHDVVLGQAVSALAARAVASYVHVNHPDHASAAFLDKLPLRISGYTHLGLGVFLAGAGQAREAAIAIPLGIGNLQLTGDLKSIVAFIDEYVPEGMPALLNAYKSHDAHFAAANFAILLPAMHAFADAMRQDGANIDVLMKVLPSVPLLAAVYYIGRNVVNDETVNVQNRAQGKTFRVVHNEGYPVMLVGATAATGGAVGLGSLASKGNLMSAFHDLGSGLLNMFNSYSAALWNVVTNDNTAPALHQISNAQDAYTASVCCASMTIGVAYALLENKYGSFFKPSRPTRICVPLGDKPEQKL